MPPSRQRPQPRPPQQREHAAGRGRSSVPPVVVASLAGAAATTVTAGTAGIDAYSFDYEYGHAYGHAHGKVVELPTPSTVPGLSGEEVAAFDLDLNLNLESFQASLRQEAGEDGNN